MNKFRVWCKNKKQWEKDIIMVNQDEDLFHFDYHMHPMRLNKNTHIVSWFTGLYDKNNKEIYTGDLLKDPTDGTITEVIFDVTELCFSHIEVKDVSYGYSFNKDQENSYYEVIGNIYEK